MADVKLIGNDALTVNDVVANTRVLYQKFAALSSANVTSIYVNGYAVTNANVKVAIYSDNAGTPGNVLAQSGDTVILKNQWNIISIASTAIVSGTYYWLAIVTNTTNGLGRRTTGGTTLYSGNVTYATFSYANAPSGLTSSTLNSQIAGWGALPSTASVGLVGQGLVGSYSPLSKGQLM
jgi:hypothetical protein